MEQTNSKFLRGIVFYVITISTSILYVLGFVLIFNIGNNFTMIWDWTNRIHVYIVIEIIIDIIALFIMNIGVKKWMHRPNKLTYITMWLLIIWSISLILAIMKKIFNFVLIPPITFEETYWSILINHYRLVWCFQAIATYLVYRLYLEVFGQEKHRISWDIFVLILTVITVAMQFLPLASTMEDTLIGSLILIQGMLIDVPIVVYSFKLSRRTRAKTKVEMTLEDRQMHYGFLFLFLLALSFILIYVSFILSNIYTIATGMIYNFFYGFQLVFTALAVFMVYIGFIMPKWFKRLIFKTPVGIKK